MKISPRYGSDPILRIGGEPAAIATPLLRQRRRFAELLASLDDAQWSAPSRCEDWRVQDVASHLTGVDQFWLLSIQSGLAGAPTQFLADFDPKATPGALVDATRGVTPQEALAGYLTANEAFCAAIEALDDDGWAAVAESPAGHVSLDALAHHALWDSWVHERDVLSPLGLAQVEEADEILASLRYAAALAPMFALQTATAPGLGTLVVAPDDLDASIVITVTDHVAVHDGDAPDGALVLRGAAIDLLDALSIRASHAQPVPADQAWLLAGLAEAFDQPAPA